MKRHIKIKDSEIDRITEGMLNERIPNNSLIVPNLQILAGVFTNKRIELIRLIGSMKPQSVSELASLSRRKKQAVCRDIKLLEGYGLIALEKKGCKRIPVLVKRALYVPLAEAPEGYKLSMKGVAVARDKKRARN